MRVLETWRAGDWEVQVVKYGRDDVWYRLTGPETHDRLALGVLQWMLKERGVDMADLRRVEPAA